jgi:hypothetical protein
MICEHYGKTLSDYTAKDIRILSDDEVVEAFDWAKAGALSVQYHRDEGWIQRGLSACQSAGVSGRYFVRRYLEGDKDMPQHEGVEAAFRALLVDNQGR